MNKRVLGIVTLSLLIVNFVSVSFTVQVSMAGNPPTILDDNSSLQNDRVVLSDRAKNLTEPKDSNDRRTEWNFSSPDEWSKVAYADGNKTRLVVGVNEENDVSLTELEEIAARHDARIVNTVTIRGRTRAAVVELMFTSVPRFVQETQLAGLADYIEPNLKVKVSLTPNDPYWSLQWGPKKIEADWAWNTTVGDSDLLVAVIDTGIDYNHPDLAANYVPLGYDWANSDPDPRDDYGHGTHCAGIIAAVMNNNVGIAGVAQVKIMAEKVLDNTGGGYADWFAEGVINATDSGAKIISISLGGYGDSELMHDSLKYAYDSGVLIVAAAANDNSNIKPYPAGYSEVVAVAATDQNDQKASFSNWGDWIELSAPGVSVYSTMPTYSVTLNGYGYSMNYDYLSGTSMACPHVAGVAALVWSRFPGKSRDWVRLWLRSTSDDLGAHGFDIYYGYGRVNARRAVEYATAQHELEAFSMAAPLYVRPGEQGIINSTVFNFGESDETDVTAQLWANGTMVSAETIDYLATGEFATVSLPWSPTVQGIYNVTAYVVPVAGEARLDNNALSKYVYVGNPVKAVVLHSSGNVLSQSITTWQELGTQWHLFGDTMIYVDYTSLNKDDISYADLAGSEADVLIISCAYDRYAGWEFTDSEIKAITQYVHEGHGLIATAGTLYNGVPNNNKLAPLFGIDDTIVWNAEGTDLLHLLNTTHPLFAKVPNPLVFQSVTTALPSDGQWDSNELVGGKYLGLGQNQESAIVTFRGLVYISPWLEFMPPYYYHHLQLLYNAITWSHYQKPPHELVASLDVPTRLKPGEYTLLNATVSNSGLSNETDVELKLFIDSTLVGNVAIPQLLVDSSYTLSYPWTPTVQGICNVTAYAPPKSGEELTQNNIATEMVMILLIAVRNALVYSDDGYVGPSSRYVIVALNDLGINYTYYADDPWGFGAALVSQPWDLVIVDHCNYYAMGQYWTELEEYVCNGGRLVLSTFDIDGSHSEPTTLWDTLGVRWASDIGAPEPVYRWLPSHAIFTFPNTVGDLTSYTQGYSDGGDHVAATTGTPIAGFTTSPTEDYAAVVVGNTYPTVLFSFRPDEFRYDQDRDGKLDAIELWGNAIVYSARGYEHDLAVSLEAPKFLGYGESTLLNATVSNRGLSNEADVELQLLINGTVVDSVLISELFTGASYTLRYLWTPRMAFVHYNVTAYALPVLGEDLMLNNRATKMVYVSFYTRTYLQPQWIGGGVPMGWHADDTSWTYTLPFSFPFYGNDYSSIYVSSNGLITFLDPDSSYGNSIPALAGKLAIAPAWNDWVTHDPYDIYIWQNSTHVGIRWYVRAYGSSTEANFEAILSADGEIQFNYQYNDGPVSPTIGISNAGAGDIIAEDVGSLNYINTIVFTPLRPEHELVVYLDAPACLEADHSALLNATVENRGLNNETNAELYLLINSSVVNSTTNITLLQDESVTITFLWTPTETRSYNITAYAPPVPGEEETSNNNVTKSVNVFFYARGYLPHRWVGEGAPMGWHGDISSWEYALPFNFPFYGRSFERIYISSKGLISFKAPDSSYGNSVPELARRLAIAPAWSDWVTFEPYDIYVQSNLTCVVIRWDVRHYGSDTEAQFESILWSDGAIEFDYLSSSGFFSATVGISNGEGHIIAEDIDDFSGVESRIFLPYRRDVAVYEVQASPAQVYSGQPVSVNVTVGNEGEMQESFDVQVFYENLALNPNVRTSIISSPASPNEPHLGDAIWIEPSFVDLDGLDIGQKFNVTLWTNLTRASFAWQIDVIHNSERLIATRAGYTAGSSSQFYSGYVTVPVSPSFWHVNETHSYVMFAEALLGDVERSAGFGSLCWIEFQILEKPYPEPVDYFELGADDTFALDPTLEMIPVTLFNGAYGSSTQPPPPPPPSNVIGTATVHLDPGTNTTIFLTWNTLGLPLGNYTLRARAMPLAGETDLDDNDFADGIVEILWRYDVAVIDLTTPVQFVYSGRNFTVDVTVQNNGDAAENVTIVAYFNASSNEILGEGELENLLPGESRTITLTAGTKNVTAGHHYVLTAVAIIEEMDYNPSDNRLAGPTITIRFLGDINGDGKVDVKDIAVLARLFGIKAGGTNWNPDCDLNSDGKIDVMDVALAARNFGKTYP